MFSEATHGRSHGRQKKVRIFGATMGCGLGDDHVRPRRTFEASERDGDGTKARKSRDLYCRNIVTYVLEHERDIVTYCVRVRSAVDKEVLVKLLRSSS